MSGSLITLHWRHELPFNCAQRKAAVNKIHNPWLATNTSMLDLIAPSVSHFPAQATVLVMMMTMALMPKPELIEGCGCGPCRTWAATWTSPSCSSRRVGPCRHRGHSRRACRGRPGRHVGAAGCASARACRRSRGPLLGRRRSPGHHRGRRRSHGGRRRAPFGAARRAVYHLMSIQQSQSATRTAAT